MWINISNDKAADLAVQLKAAGFAELSQQLENELAYQDMLSRKTLLDHAKGLYEDNDCDVEVDDDAATSEADDGAWVMMWGWVNYDEAGIQSSQKE